MSNTYLRAGYYLERGEGYTVAYFSTLTGNRKDIDATGLTKRQAIRHASRLNSALDEKEGQR